MRQVCATCLYHFLVRVLQLSFFFATLWTCWFSQRNLSWGFYQPKTLCTFSNSLFYLTPINIVMKHLWHMAILKEAQDIFLLYFRQGYILSRWTISDFSFSVFSFQGYYTQTLLLTPSRALWKEGRKVEVLLWNIHLMWMFTTESEHEINPLSSIMFAPFQWATSLSHITNCGSKYTICCNQRHSQAAPVALQRSPTNLFLPFSVTAQVFFNHSSQSIR